MNAYWDGSALVAATLDRAVRDQLVASGAVTRTHSLAEVFSTLTGSRLGFRVDADDAVRVIRDLLREIEVVELSAAEVMDALAEARSRGVRGGRVHDFLHAVAARKTNCASVVTLNQSDFEGLFKELIIKPPI